MVIGGSQPAAWEDFVGGLAEGASGLRFFDWRTGEYAYTDDAVLAAIELLLAMRDDGSIFPGSVNLNNPQSRATLPQGGAGMIIQGPWNIPQWQRESPDFAFGVSSQPVPASGTSFPLGYGPGGTNTLWVYANSPHQAIAGDMFAYIGSPAGQTAWAQLVGVGDPPAIISAFEGVELDPLAQRAYGYSRELMRLRPDPRIRNPETAQVFVQQRPITPDVGETIQGLYSGQVSDARAAMQEVQDRANAELERAIAAAQQNGAEVSRDDWVFPDWDPNQDYTPEDAATPTA
jgi:multiple sugar transport system substrate-binding protein